MDIFGQTLINGMSTLYEESLCQDVTVYVGDHSYPCHKTILLIWSDYFKAMFNSGMKEEKDNKIHLKDDHLTSPEAFKAILQYMYKGEINLNKDNVFEILSCVSYLRVKAIGQICIDYIEGLLKANDLPSAPFLRTLFLDNDDSHLKEIAVQFVAGNFTKVAETQDFLDHMTTEGICEILDNPHLEDLPEMMIIKAATRWLMHKQERMVDMTKVYQCLKLGQLNPDELQQVCCDYIQSTSPDKDDFMKTLFHLLANVSKQTFSVEVQEKYPKMFIERKRDQVLAVIRMSIGEVAMWEHPRGFPEKNYHLPCGGTLASNIRMHFAFNEECKELFRGFSFQKSKASIPFQKYDAASKNWNNLPIHNLIHRCPCIVALGKKLFVIDSANNQCEIFDRRLNQWLQVKTCPHEIEASYCVAFQDLIYISFKNQCLTTIHVSVYNPRENRWSTGCTYTYKRYFRNVLTSKINNHLFNCHTESGQSKCSVYDICCKGREIPQPDIPEKYRGPPAIQIEDDIYIVLNGLAVKTDIDVNDYRPYTVSLEEWKKFDKCDNDYSDDLWMCTSRSFFEKKAKQSKE